MIGCTAAYFWYADIVRQTATILNRPTEAKKYAERSAAIRESFNQHFLSPDTGLYPADSQTAPDDPDVAADFLRRQQRAWRQASGPALKVRRPSWLPQVAAAPPTGTVGGTVGGGTPAPLRLAEFTIYD